MHDRGQILTGIKTVLELAENAAHPTTTTNAKVLDDGRAALINLADIFETEPAQ